MITGDDMRPLVWMGSSLRDFRGFPDAVKAEIGYALYLAQCGDRHRKVKTLKGFGGAGVLEVVDDHDGSTFRTVYAVRFASAVYVLHAFQKKSKTGIATPRPDIELIERRLIDARRLHEERQP